jgi:hypothetical protein
LKWIAVAVASLLVAGCTSSGPALPPEWKGRDLNEPGWQNTTIRPGWSFSLEYNWPAQREVAWDWVVPNGTNLTFTLSRMSGSFAFPIHSSYGSDGQGTYTTRVDGVYFLVWDGDRQPETKLHFKAPEGARRAEWPPGTGPGCPGGLLLMVC